MPGNRASHEPSTLAEVRSFVSETLFKRTKPSIIVIFSSNRNEKTI